MSSVAGRSRVLAIANRGEIALRIARTAQALGWRPIALIGAADRDALVTRVIDTAILPFAGAEFDPDAVAGLAQQVGADALHPGYGFLSERAEIAEACAARGIAFVGPAPETLATCGDKAATRSIAARNGVPVLPASAAFNIDSTNLHAAADAVGYPLMVKIAGGGGGRGLRVATDAEALDAAIAAAVREAGSSAAGVTFFFERYLQGARHVEVQVIGDGRTAVALGDRDCTLQRRHQKVIEEAPAASLHPNQRMRLHADAVRLATALKLVSLATVEFLLEPNGQHWFIEVNPRLQVEHTVTEEITGLDLVALQLHLLDGGALPAVPTPRGHAVQARLYAEDPFHQFVPAPGMLRVLHWPRLPGVRIETGYASGDTIPGDYDPLIAKIITHHPTRDGALDLLAQALRQTQISGTAHNRPWLLALLDDPDLRSNTHTLDTAAAVQVTRTPPPTAALSAAARALLPDTDGSAWGSHPAFRIGSPATVTLHGDDAGGWQMTASVTPADMAEDGDDVLAIQTPEGIEISTTGGWWLAQVGGRAAARAGAATQDGRVRAPMPGTVTAVHVTAGQRVTAGAPLVTMTAMKIDIALAAPLDGVVQQVDCVVGDLLSSQQIVALIVAAPDPASDSTPSTAVNAENRNTNA